MYEVVRRSGKEYEPSKQSWFGGMFGGGGTGELNLNTVTIPEKFDATAIKQAITDIQQRKIKYQTFLRRIMEAGCAHYKVFITGKKAIYVGRNGDQHIELFSKPK